MRNFSEALSRLVLTGAGRSGLEGVWHLRVFVFT
jgi:hypothetical protein